ncbi:diguanylate cyclase [Desulfovibrio mangrovi]|uniref:diguanylate cyclase n=1 Tax=Desulfovibrio mangrovi TaxID=2976983 RepID=UPI002247ED86|nr:diguanylate cyclase [Desulfovibrio mangrovi]UZP68974.1 diguanylate cyclase [Desulfovibrio mangrovi]
MCLDSGNIVLDSKDNQYLFENAFTYAAIGMALVALDGKWLKVNDALCNMLGYSESELLCKTFQDITHPDDLEEDLAYVHKMISGDIETYQMEKRYFNKYGHVIDILLSVSLVFDGGGNPRFFISQIQDITMRKKLEQELARISREDSLTSVFNRRHFVEVASREIRRGERFSEIQTLLMIDIDHFKHVNDTYGHAVGDEVLRKMAAACKACLREVDVFGRLGGEEFGALLLRANAKVASALAERLRKHVGSIEVVTESGVVRFTVSIGGVTFVGGESLENRMRIADAALYQAKGTGRNRTVLTDLTEQYIRPRREETECFVRLQWAKGYESGNVLVDREHQHLFYVGNELLKALVSGEADSKVADIADELFRHVVAHFQNEYAIIRDAGYPEAEQHGKIHDALVTGMETSIRRFRAGELAASELFTFLVRNVVGEHLLKEDRKFFPYIS